MVDHVDHFINTAFQTVNDAKRHLFEFQLVVTEGNLPVSTRSALDKSAFSED